jgi:hypothetical protein
MSSLNVGGGLYLHDAQGARVGVVLPERELRELLAERDALRKEAADLRERLSRMQAERDEYCQALDVISEDKSLMFDRKELDQARKMGVTLDVILRDLDEPTSQGTTEAGRGEH